jgi:hypothetical protein
LSKVTCDKIVLDKEEKIALKQGTTFGMLVSKGLKNGSMA